MKETPENLAALKTEIALPAYAGMDESAIAAALSARTIDADVDVATLDIDRYLAVNGIWGKIDARVDWLRAKLAAEASADSAVEQRIAALRTMARALERLPSFTTATAGVKTSVFALIENLYLPIGGTPAGEGLITLQQRNQLRALAAGKISRAEQLFGRGETVGSGEVSRAKKV